MFRFEHTCVFVKTCVYAANNIIHEYLKPGSINDGINLAKIHNCKLNTNTKYSLIMHSPVICYHIIGEYLVFRNVALLKSCVSH